MASDSDDYNPESPPGVAAKNAAMREKVGAALRQKNKIFADYISLARDKHPEISPKIFDDMISSSNGSVDQLIAKVAAANELVDKNGSHVPLDQNWVNAEVHKAYAEVDRGIGAYVRENNPGKDKEIDEVFKLVNKETPKKEGSLFSAPGIVGGGVGLLLGLLLFGGGGEGGLLGMIPMLLVAAVGVYLGNKYTEVKQNQKVLDSYGPSPDKDIEKGKGQEIKRDNPPAESKDNGSGKDDSVSGKEPPSKEPEKNKEQEIKQDNPPAESKDNGSGKDSVFLDNIINMNVGDSSSVVAKNKLIFANISDTESRIPNLSKRMSPIGGNSKSLIT